jgi:hypothetical protein
MLTGDNVAEFIRGTLLIKIKEDLTGLRIFNKADLLAAAYYHCRRYFLTLPGCMVRVNPDLQGKKPDLAVFLNNEPLAFLQFEFSLVPKQFRYFPTMQLDEKMKLLRNVTVLYKNKGVKGWLYGVFDTDETVFYPTVKDKDAQLTIWLPVNVRELRDYTFWRKKWDELKPRLF